MTPSNNEAKRKHAEVDLTGDSTDDDASQQKTQKTASRMDAQRRGEQTTPGASQTSPRSSDQAPSSSVPGQSQSYNNQGGYVYPPGAGLPRSFASPYSSYRPEDGTHSQAERESWLVADDNEDHGDMDEIVSSTQGAADNDELHLFGNLPTKIVGVQYYRGIANPGEYILLRREPGNPYDRNSIRVDNVGGEQIGHIPRRIAAKLASYMDSGWLFVEGRLSGRMGQLDCPIEVDLLGPDPRSQAGKQLVDKMKADKLPTKALLDAERREKQRQKEIEQARKKREQEEKRKLAEARKAAAGAGKGGAVPISQDSEFTNQTMPDSESEPVMSDLVEASQRFNPRQVSNTTDQYGLQEEALKSMPLASKPASIKTEMLPFQLQALQWLLDQESPQPPAPGSKDTIQLWKRHESVDAFTNIASNYSTKEAPQLASGGILADDMGLGKTLEMISLIIADAEKFGRGSTLIVAPLSVMSNWSGQIAHHVHENMALKVYTYHGSGRVSMKAEDFAQYDVVVTTYQTLAMDYMPRGKGAPKQPEKKLRANGLYSMDWRRVILDEGHAVRNPASKGAAAVTSLMSRSRWVLTGTPIINSLKDLYSLLRFIGITGGLNQLEIFNSVLIRPLKAGDPSATYLLQAVMTAFTLRRRKEMAFIDLRLPQLDEYVHRVPFTDKERERYNALHAEATGVASKVMSGKPGEQSKTQVYAHLLEVLLRMRQCCNHWQLCGQRVTALMEELEKSGTVQLTRENKEALQKMLQLQIESHEECAICLEALHGPVITVCGHSFGFDCISKVIETQHKCPLCRNELQDVESTLVGPQNEGEDEDHDNDLDLTQSSSKLEAMMKILSATKNNGKGEKTVIFSQWTRFLDIVQSRLDREGSQYCRLDGTMSAPRRDASLQALETDPSCTIMLASLGVCAVGLNLTAANQIILSDTWWAPAIEDQAVDRVHRLGQKRETRVWRLVMEESIEEKTLVVQSEKRKLMQLAFAEEGKKARKKEGRMADIQKLLA
ncbi:SNF2 family DNA-dependent ATPase domain-containing protein [Hortaea werneckii]|nr:SNF2 family DNA-dependent ATPase domain-containing protein [Hortaea werneckii]KAI7314419.1 SNF2 family DNA-dependent ATPase domain-containing protein [Hortaea werneckii]